MVNWKLLAGRAKNAYDNADKDDLKRKAEELKGVASGQGTLTDKARAAADVVTKNEEAETAEAGEAAEADPDAGAKPASEGKSKGSGPAA